MFMSPFLVTDIKRFDLSLRKVNQGDESNFMDYVHVCGPIKNHAIVILNAS